MSFRDRLLCHTFHVPSSERGPKPRQYCVEFPLFFPRIPMTVSLRMHGFGLVLSLLAINTGLADDKKPDDKKPVDE
jgi:hypothetical protein